MSQNRIEIAAPPERVWAVLAEPGSYDDWVFGARSVEGADETWPAVGAALRHRTGVGPLTVEDETVVEQSEPPSRLVLLASVGPVGSFRVRLSFDASPAGTVVQMLEEPVEGVAAHVPGQDVALAARNTLSLRRLKKLAESPPAER